MPGGATTYRLKLEREDNGQTVQQWSGIAEERIRPLLDGLARFVPMLVQAAAAKRAINETLKFLAGPEVLRYMQRRARGA